MHNPHNTAINPLYVQSEKRVIVAFNSSPLHTGDASELSPSLFADHPLPGQSRDLILSSAVQFHIEIEGDFSRKEGSQE